MTTTSSCIVPHCRCWFVDVPRQCERCGATWVGKVHEACTWCMWREHHRRQAIRTEALAWPDVDPWMASSEAAHVIHVAGLRLADAVAEGVVTHEEAERALALWRKRLARTEAA